MRSAAVAGSCDEDQGAACSLVLSEENAAPCKQLHHRCEERENRDGRTHQENCANSILAKCLDHWFTAFLG